MAKKFKLDEKTLKALFDYNLFSHNQKLELLAQESLAAGELRLGDESLDAVAGGYDWASVKMPDILGALKKS